MKEGRSISTEGRSSPDLGCRDLGTMKHRGTRGLTEDGHTQREGQHQWEGFSSGVSFVPLHLASWHGSEDSTFRRMSISAGIKNFLR